ncbi:MAG: hypothetical protein C0473_02800 [Cyanobacteria bacterium DS3.002]|jgi:hypothetical protein|nr:hypothetical protein [Cyanobacteria bacterium DS3.002]
MPLTAEQKYVRNRYVEFLSRLAALAKQYPPYAPNAASGHFRNNVVSDAKIIKAGRAAEIPLAGVDKEFFKEYLLFYKGIFRSFKKHENHHASWTGNSGLFLASFKTLAPTILKLAKAIGGLYEGDLIQIKAVVEETNRLIEDTKQRNFSNNGRHASGHISVGVKEAVTQCIASFALRKFSKNLQSQQIVLACYRQLNGLSTKRHDPWLKANWQLRFYAICKMSAVRLKAL